MQNMQKLTISRLARLGGVNLETVRYYERRGLLPNRPERKQATVSFPQKRCSDRDSSNVLRS
jgi:MerR family mercuric resistance operon transcriptional regulator